MPDTDIARVNTLGGDQSGKLTFIDWHDQFIGDVQISGVPPETPTTSEHNNVDIEIPGVELVDNFEFPGVDGDDNETPKLLRFIMILTFQHKTHHQLSWNHPPKQKFKYNRS